MSLRNALDHAVFVYLNREKKPSFFNFFKIGANRANLTYRMIHELELKYHDNTKEFLFAFVNFIHSDDFHRLWLTSSITLFNYLIAAMVAHFQLNSIIAENTRILREGRINFYRANSPYVVRIRETKPQVLKRLLREDDFLQKYIIPQLQTTFIPGPMSLRHLSLSAIKRHYPFYERNISQLPLELREEFRY